MSKGALAYFKDKLCLRLWPSLREDVNGNKTNAHGNNSTATVSQQRGNQHGNESALMKTNQLQQQATNMKANQTDKKETLAD